jgi:ABC-type amino acid transport substrate-binding protein
MSQGLLRLIAVAPALALSPLLPVRQPAADEPAVFPDIQRILDAGVIRLAIRARDAPPMMMTDADGAPARSEPDLARDLAKMLGVAVEFVRTADT